MKDRSGPDRPVRLKQVKQHNSFIWSHFIFAGFDLYPGFLKRIIVPEKSFCSWLMKTLFDTLQEPELFFVILLCSN